MKSILIALASVPMVYGPALADIQLLPSLFADRYCTLRKLGWNQTNAIEAAIDFSKISGTAPRITVQGSSFGVDVIESVQKIKQICPLYTPISTDA